jgi:hypothetical protein
LTVDSQKQKARRMAGFFMGAGKSKPENEKPAIRRVFL